MAAFRTSRPYTMPREDVRAAAEELAQELEDRFGIRARWTGDTVAMSGHGVDGKLVIDDDTVSVDVKMGLMASMFERSLRRVVDEYLDEYIS